MESSGQLLTFLCPQFGATLTIKLLPAEANITLVENINPTLKVADLPVITYTSAVPQQNKPSDKPKADDVLDYTQGQIRSQT